jgi:hypothetical protein
MTPEYYADLYKCYQTYVRSYSGNAHRQGRLWPEQRRLPLAHHRSGTRGAPHGRDQPAITTSRASGNWTDKGRRHPVR